MHQDVKVTSFASTSYVCVESQFEHSSMHSIVWDISFRQTEWLPQSHSLSHVSIFGCNLRKARLWIMVIMDMKFGELVLTV